MATYAELYRQTYGPKLAQRQFQIWTDTEARLDTEYKDRESLRRAKLVAAQEQADSLNEYIRSVQDAILTPAKQGSAGAQPSSVLLRGAEAYARLAEQEQQASVATAKGRQWGIEQGSDIGQPTPTALEVVSDVSLTARTTGAGSAGKLAAIDRTLDSSAVKRLMDGHPDQVSANLRQVRGALVANGVTQAEADQFLAGKVGVNPAVLSDDYLFSTSAERQSGIDQATEVGGGGGFRAKSAELTGRAIDAELGGGVGAVNPEDIAAAQAFIDSPDGRDVVKAAQDGAITEDELMQIIASRLDPRQSGTIQPGAADDLLRGFEQAQKTVAQYPTAFSPIDRMALDPRILESRAALAELEGTRAQYETPTARPTAADVRREAAPEIEKFTKKPGEGTRLAVRPNAQANAATALATSVKSPEGRTLAQITARYTKGARSTNQSAIEAARQLAAAREAGTIKDPAEVVRRAAEFSQFSSETGDIDTDLRDEIILAYIQSRNSGKAALDTKVVAPPKPKPAQKSTGVTTFVDEVE